ncbi:TPA: type VI secretion system ImpA family N-terminal domain-containing protein [Enterobacter hormaechei subsp. xiangfangensis]|nr:type VI secretion system ImpA family N-terminal domain-containing protein [Enterobacter hormaechei subsp. xiangfangensis]
MSGISVRHVKTGGDPRTLSDFIALRDEMNKLTHPARPDIDWPKVETLALSLFEHNDIELQTATWYTLALSHLARVSGMNEGLALTGALLAHQWSLFWPGNTHARVEILSDLFSRLQNVFRTLALTDSQDLALLYQCEKQLAALFDTLSRHELKQVSRADGLLQQVRQAITRLENAPHEAATEPVVVGAALWGWHAWHQISPAGQRFTAALTPFPGVLSSEQTVALRQEGLPVEQGLAQLQTQLKWLTTRSPDWSLRYGQQMIHQAQMLWPESPQVAAVQSGWQQQIAANALPLDTLNRWHDGMMKQQQLTDRLNALDGQKGKYITVSELKSQVFAISQAFSQAPLVEEQLRQLQQQTDASPALTQQTAMHLNQLLTRYALLTYLPGKTMP